MKLKKYFIIFINITIVVPSYCDNKVPDPDYSTTFDLDLYESVLDPELCERQLDYIRTNPFLRLEFLASGMRLPRGILKGNLEDFGNYPQCLAINEELEDMTIQGKYCSLHLPLDFYLDMRTDNMLQQEEQLVFNKTNIVEIFERINKDKSLLAREGLNMNNLNRMFVPHLSVALCLPQPCTSREALKGLLFDTSILGIESWENFCRLPNDKPYVAADYVAWVIFGLLGLVTILSTCYDVRHTVFLKKDPKEANPLLSAFSVYKNTLRILQDNKRPGTLECLDGVRVLSTLWVVIGHSFGLAAVFQANPIDIHEWYISLNAIWLKAAPLAVDTFFLLSGLLVVYTTVKKFTTWQLLKNLHIFYLNRLLRIFPVLAAVILFQTSVYHHISDGPHWWLPAADTAICRSYWWITLLHLQNILTPHTQCVPESWYLAIDVHLHILSPLVLLWVVRGTKKSAWFGVTSGFLVSLTAATIYYYTQDFSPEGVDKYIHFHVNVLTRAPPFFIGMFYGYLLHLWREGTIYKIPKVIGYVITALSLAFLGLIIYGKHLYTHGDITEELIDFLTIFQRSAWAIGVGWIIFACVNGYAEPINWFLSLSVWKIPSRISYSMYLIHMSLMIIYYGSTIQPIRFSVGLYMFDFFAFLYLTLFIGFFLTVLIDAPFATVFGIMLLRVSKFTRNVESPKEVSKPDQQEISQEKPST